METAVQKAVRLLGALDELIQQEAAHLRGAEYERARQVRERAEPFVTELVQLAYEPGVAALRPRVAAVVGRSATHASFLQEKLDEMRLGLSRIDQAQRRAAQIAPAYGCLPVVPLPRFQAAC